jgi:hypothetical protein
MLLGALILWSLVPLAVLLLPRHTGVFNGSYGLQVVDHLQHLAWVRDSGEHLMFSNLFDVSSDPHLFLHPMMALSGLLWRLGASIQVAYLAWKPVALGALFIGFAAYVRKTIGRDAVARGVALGLALFFLTPAAALSQWLGTSQNFRFGTLVVGLESFAGGYLWGGSSGTVAAAMVPLFLLGAGRLLEDSGGRTRVIALLTGAAGLIASWLHPWQGLVLLVIVGGLFVWARFDRRYFRLTFPCLLTAVPFLYFWFLAHTDSSWAYVSRPNHLPHVGMWLAVAFAPAVLAVPGYFVRAEGVQDRMLKLWPAAALVVYFGLQRSWFYHAFVALSLPLAVLAVRGLWRLRIPRWMIVGAVVVATAPGLIFVVQQLQRTREEHFLDPGEAKALAYIDESPRSGPVLASLRLGNAVPGFTGRKTWVGHYYWTPNYERRRLLAADFFAGRLKRSEALRVLVDSRATFLLAGCPERGDVRRELGSMPVRVRHFGCATVYELRDRVRSEDLKGSISLRALSPRRLIS